MIAKTSSPVYKYLFSPLGNRLSILLFINYIFNRYLSLILNIELETLPINLAFEHQLSNGVWLCQVLDEVMPGKDLGSRIYDTDHDTYMVSCYMRD